MNLKNEVNQSCVADKRKKFVTWNNVITSTSSFDLFPKHYGISSTKISHIFLRTNAVFLHHLSSSLAISSSPKYTLCSRNVHYKYVSCILLHKSCSKLKFWFTSMLLLTKTLRDAIMMHLPCQFLMNFLNQDNKILQYLLLLHQY